MSETVTISKKEYSSLKKKAKLAENVLFQLKASFEDLKAGRVKPAQH